jgi:NAD(P)-dependent dehydrogenase (short-subunit alcohol dehydrogenase family)
VTRVHLRGHFCVTRHAVDHWRARLKAGDEVDARIINTASGAGLQGSVGQSAYAAAKGGIASLTLVQAAELGRYGITANALAPNARTRMTEGPFGEIMKPVEGQFDAFHAGNMAPLVTWLCSEESKNITGQVFELKGGHITIEEGWRDGPSFDKGAKLTIDEIGEIVPRLVAQRHPPKPVYGTVGAVV